MSLSSRTLDILSILPDNSEDRIDGPSSRRLVPGLGDALFRAAQILIAALVVATHVASSSLLVTSDAFPGPDQETSEDSCCPTDATPPEDDASRDPEGCCPSGCEHCPLSCCGGSPALAGLVLVAPGRPAESTVLLLPPCRKILAADPPRIDHPPRV